MLKSHIKGDVLLLPVWSSNNKAEGSYEYEYKADDVKIISNKTSRSKKDGYENVMKEFKPTIDDLKSSLVLRAFLKENGFNIEVEPKKQELSK